VAATKSSPSGPGALTARRMAPACAAPDDPADNSREAIGYHPSPAGHEAFRQGQQLTVRPVTRLRPGDPAPAPGGPPVRYADASGRVQLLAAPGKTCSCDLGMHLCPVHFRSARKVPGVLPLDNTRPDRRISLAPPVTAPVRQWWYRVSHCDLDRKVIRLWRAWARIETGEIIWCPPNRNPNAAEA